MKLRFSIAHFSVKHRNPFKNSFCPSRRHRRQTASRCLANFLFSLPQTLNISLVSQPIPATREIKLCGVSADGSRCAESACRPESPQCAIPLHPPPPPHPHVRNPPL